MHAIHQGRVLFADWFRGQGLLLIVDHGDGYLSLYGHNHSLMHTTGDWIKTGDVIATVGASGADERVLDLVEAASRGLLETLARR